MKVKDLIEKLNFKLVATETNTDREIKGLHYGDLLSWVMAHAKQGDAWVTIQTHINVVAVASLIDISCIIIPESIAIDQDTIEKANKVDIPILSTDLDTYKIFCGIYEMGLR
jgi:serine kinase of HPr protein (carbohydrate metabolism regulator)